MLQSDHERDHSSSGVRCVDSLPTPGYSGTGASSHHSELMNCSQLWQCMVALGSHKEHGEHGEQEEHEEQELKVILNS